MVDGSTARLLSRVRDLSPRDLADRIVATDLAALRDRATSARKNALTRQRLSRPAAH